MNERRRIVKDVDYDDIIAHNYYIYQLSFYSDFGSTWEDPVMVKLIIDYLQENVYPLLRIHTQKRNELWAVK
jgi:hypothetical protein